MLEKKVFGIIYCLVKVMKSHLFEKVFCVMISLVLTGRKRQGKGISRKRKQPAYGRLLG
jgi:hypothetical protein